MEKQQSIQAWVDKGFWALITACAFYVSSQMKELSNSVAEMNLKLSAYIERSENQAHMLADHEARLREIERN